MLKDTYEKELKWQIYIQSSYAPYNSSSDLHLNRFSCRCSIMPIEPMKWSLSPYNSAFDSHSILLVLSVYQLATSTIQVIFLEDHKRFI